MSTVAEGRDSGGSPRVAGFSGTVGVGTGEVRRGETAAGDPWPRVFGRSGTQCYKANQNPEGHRGREDLTNRTIITIIINNNNKRKVRGLREDEQGLGGHKDLQTQTPTSERGSFFFFSLSVQITLERGGVDTRLNKYFSTSDIKLKVDL